MSNPLAELAKLGQSVWYDQMQRSLVTEGGLQKLIERDDLRGLTSNPTIFEKAIGGTEEYDSQLERLALEGKSRDEILEAIMVEDIGMATDVFRKVYEKTKGLDGFCSLEVSPLLARDTKGTIAEGLKLFKLLGRDNVMIKVPATPEGIPAVEELIYNGVNVNITLIFSREVYAQVMEAYIRGLERRVAEGKPVGDIASVASFFVSRIDTKADAALEKKIAAATSDAEKGHLSSMLGKVAIANAKAAYQLFKDTFATERAMKVRNAGAALQRPLWASTGTKNPKYRDTLYVEELIGDNTVNTIPPATYEAFRDHGKVEPTLERDLEGAMKVLADFEAAGLSLAQITKELTDEGVKSFDASFISLVDTIEARRDGVERRSHKRDVLHLGKFQGDVDQTVESLQKEKAVSRIWKKEAALWKSDEAHQKIISNSLGWLTVAEEMQRRLPELKQIAEETKSFSHVVLLGMGGSSLCAEVFRRTFGKIAGHPELLVLDSTVPAAVSTLEKKLDLANTLFIVASKSGGTTEPAMFHKYFYDRVKSVKGDKAGQHFIAITDPGTVLESQAKSDGFRKIFSNMADIGGRYSVLSYFGMVPAAICGIDVEKLLDRAVHAAHTCSDKEPTNENAGALLGAAIGTLATKGRNKLTLLLPRSIASLGLWIEQLVAESTGKEGKGILPVAGEPLTDAKRYGNDRQFVYLRLANESDSDLDAHVAAVKAAGHPVMEMVLRDTYDLGEAFFLWEFATAVAGRVTGIDPFDQPNVQESKDNTKALLEQFKSSGALPARQPVVTDGEVRIFSESGVEGSTLNDALSSFLSRVKEGDYVAFTHYIEETVGHDESIRAMRQGILDARGIATTSGYGPRFLHSTGQLHKGGSDEGVFIQITADDAADVKIPGEPFTFGVLKAAQSAGDFQSLVKRNRRAINVHLGTDVAAGLQRLRAAIEQAMSAAAK